MCLFTADIPLRYIFRVDYNVLLTAEYSFSNCENDGKAFPDFLVSITFTLKNVNVLLS